MREKFSSMGNAIFKLVAERKRVATGKRDWDAGDRLSYNGVNRI